MSFSMRGAGIRSYVPELEFLKNKKERGCRLCREDCFVLDATANYRVVAHRSATPLPRQEGLSAFGISAEEEHFLKQALRQKQTRLLLQCDRGAVLVFADWLNALGLLVLIFPHVPKEIPKQHQASALLYALQRMHRSELTASCAVTENGHTEVQHADALCEQMEELFFYTDLIFSHAPFARGAWTVVHRLAHFSGCRLQENDRLLRIESLFSNEALRLTAFLMCAFLSMRQEHGKMVLDDGADLLPVSLSIKPNGLMVTEEEELLSHRARRATRRVSAEQASFLDCACFCSFGAEATDKTEEATTLAAMLWSGEDSDGVHSIGQRSECYLLVLRCCARQDRGSVGSS